MCKGRGRGGTQGHLMQGERALKERVCEGKWGVVWRTVLVLRMRHPWSIPKEVVLRKSRS